MLIVVSLLLRFLFLFSIFVPHVSALTVIGVQMLSQAARADYVMAGESARLSCSYLITDDTEHVTSVRWTHNSEPVYFATPAPRRGSVSRRPVALGILKGHVDYNNADLLNTIVILNVTTAMDGVWACHVASNRTESSSQVFMTVIESVCRESQWKTHSNMITCSEEISFFCEKMFPKPSPVCSLHDDATGRFVAAETFDLNEQRPDGHFQVSIRRRYRAEDYVNATKPGQLSFRCHLVVLMTSWRLGIDYKLFGDAGCDPEQITTPANGHVSIMGEETCWRTPREGATLHVTCRDGYSLYGPQSFVCRNASWTPFVASNWSRPECRSGSERPTIFAGLVYFFISTSLRMLLAFRT